MLVDKNYEPNYIELNNLRQLDNILVGGYDTQSQDFNDQNNRASSLTQADKNQLETMTINHSDQTGYDRTRLQTP